MQVPNGKSGGHSFIEVRILCAQIKWEGNSGVVRWQDSDALGMLEKEWKWLIIGLNEIVYSMTAST